jgi:pyrimidine-nucleoside phosphorylase
MNAVEIIKLKQKNKKLSKEQMEFFIDGYLDGNITDYQMSAFLMCIYFNGLDEEETFELTEVMLKSGEIVDLNFIDKVKVDKHSTGGVGDKTSIILAPLVASCGIAVPMISGRGLGHTGGTLDKLESIPGFKVHYSIEDYKRIISKTGVVMIGQTSELAPADKRIYALRDVTATIENVSLVTASIMSKKLAEGSDAIVFDIKIGVGANLPDYDESLKLTKYLISVSKKFGKKAIAILTDMHEPLGCKIGNWLEVEECIELMNGKIVHDLSLVNETLAGAMLKLGGKVSGIDDGIIIAREKLKDGSVYKKFLEIVEIQNGDIKYINDWKDLKRAKYSKAVKADISGYVSKINAYKFGLASIELGCGRKKVSDKIDYLAGIILNKKSGNRVEKGDILYTLFAEDEAKILHAEKHLNKAFDITNKASENRKLILDIIY